MALELPAANAFIADVLAFLPNIIVAVLIFVIAAALAGAVAGAVQKLMGDTPTGKVVTAVVPGLILAIGMFMVLNQLKIAEEIVTITYAALLGMLALAGALAFGLGGRDVASRMLNDAYQSGQENKDQVKRDMRKGKEEAKSTAQSAQDAAAPPPSASTASPTARAACPARPAPRVPRVPACSPRLHATAVRRASLGAPFVRPRRPPRRRAARADRRGSAPSRPR